MIEAFRMRPGGRFGVVLLACALMVLPRALAAQAPAEVQARIYAAIEAGEAERARALALEAGADAVDLLHVEALNLLRAGKPGPAAELLRAVVRARPDDRTARRSLVRALVRQERWDAALYQIDELIARTPERQARTVLERERGAILARRPWGLEVGVSLRPSSNINRATSNTTVPGFGGFPVGTIDETGEQGLGVSVSAGAFRRFALEERSVLRLDVFGGYTRFSERELDRGYGGVAATWTRGLERGALDLRVEAVRGLHRDATDDFWLGAVTVVRRGQAGRLGWQAGGRLTRQIYDDAARAAVYDSTRAEAFAGLRYGLGPRTSVSPSVRVTRSGAEDPRFSYGGVRLDLGLERGWEAGVTTGLELWAEVRRYDEVYGGPFTAPRRDREAGVTGSVRFDRVNLWGAVPRVACTISTVISNVTFYDDLDVTECALGLTRRF